MPTGDSLAAWGMFIGAAMAAFSTSGRRAIVLWFLTAGLFLVALAYSGALPSLDLPRVAGLVNALIAPTVIGAVIILFREREVRVDAKPRPSPAPPPTSAQLGLIAKQHVDNARLGMHNDNTAASAERQWQRLNAFLLTLKRERGLPLPKWTGNRLVDVQYAIRLLQAVSPLLLEGHDDAARETAQDLIARLNS